MSFPPGSPEWLEEHGIDPEVWEARGVWRYEHGDRNVKEAFRDLISDTQLGTVTKIVNQSGGLVLPKRAPDGFPAIPPQLKPDIPVITDARPTIHFHGPLEGDWPTFPEDAPGAGKPMPRRLVMTPDVAELHIGKAHDGINVVDVHRHEPHAAKYVLLGDNKRIDLQPLAAERLPSADRVYFVIEGALKNDAVLSAGEAVFSVPSVTLWDPRELRRFAPLLRHKTVIVVPDSDWYEKWQVDQQALFVRTELRRLGIDAYIMAPPDVVGYDKVGVDDWLGMHGGTLDGLMLRGKEVPEAVRKWVGLFYEQRNHRARKALIGLSLHASEAGRHQRSLGSLSKIMATSKRQVVETLEDLGGAITIHGSLETQVKTWHGVQVLDWTKERPMIEIENEYRAEDQGRLVAKDFWARAAHDLASSTARRVDELERIERARASLEAADVIEGFEGLLDR